MNTQDPIEIHKPNPSIREAFEIDEKLSDKDLTFDIFKKIVLARKTQDLVFLSIGKMLKIVRDRKLYKYLDYENFSQFLESEEISFSREKAYLYIRTYELYVEKLMLDPDEVGKLGVARLMIMTPVVKGLSREEAIKKLEDAKPLRYGDFIRQVKQEANKNGKPNIYFSEESKRWVIQYYEDTSHLVPLGKFNSQE